MSALLRVGGLGQGYRPLLRRAPDKTITFTGAANLGQAGTNVTVYTTTGRVMVVHAPGPFCTANLGEAAATATISIGTVSAPDNFWSAFNSTTLNQNEWMSAFSSIPSADGMGGDIVGGGGWDGAIMLSEDIVIACAAQNTNAGTLVFQGWLYYPLTADGKLS